MIENERGGREDGMIAASESMVVVWVVLQLVNWALIPNVCSRSDWEEYQEVHIGTWVLSDMGWKSSWQQILQIEIAKDSAHIC